MLSLLLIVVILAGSAAFAARHRLPPRLSAEGQRLWRELRLRSVGYPLALVMERMYEDALGSIVPSVTKRYVPNVMAFGLHPKDVRRWGECFGPLAEELTDLVLREVQARPDLVLSGDELRVSFFEDPEAEPGRPTFAASMEAPVAAVADGRASRGTSPHDGRTRRDATMAKTALARPEGGCWTLLLGDRPPIPLSGEMVVGRARDADIRVASGNISRRHARLSVVDGGVSVVDLDSANGTYINGQQVAEARIEAGDRVRFGATTAIVEPRHLQR